MLLCLGISRVTKIEVKSTEFKERDLTKTKNIYFRLTNDEDDKFISLIVLYLWGFLFSKEQEY